MPAGGASFCACAAPVAVTATIRLWARSEARMIKLALCRAPGEPQSLTLGPHAIIRQVFFGLRATRRGASCRARCATSVTFLALRARLASRERRARPNSCWRLRLTREAHARIPGQDRPVLPGALSRVGGVRRRHGVARAAFLTDGYGRRAAARRRRARVRRAARLLAEAAFGTAQLPADRASALLARVHSPRDPSVFPRDSTTRNRRSRGSSARSFTSARKVSPTSGRSGPNSTNARRVTGGSTTRSCPRRFPRRISA